MHSLKRIVVVAVSMTALASCSKIQPTADTASDDAALREMSLNWFTAYNAEDLDALMALYAEDAVQINPGAPPLHGRAEIRNIAAQAFSNPIYDGIDATMSASTEYGVSGDMGWESGSYSNMDESRTPVGIINYVTIYKKIDGKWLIIRDIWNSQTDAGASVSAPVPQAAAPAPAEG